MDALRQGIHLRSYGQTNPLLAYQEEGMEMFDNLISNIQDEIVLSVARTVVEIEVEATEE